MIKSVSLILFCSLLIGSPHTTSQTLLELKRHRIVDASGETLNGVYTIDSTGQILTGDITSYNERYLDSLSFPLTLFNQNVSIRDGTFTRNVDFTDNIFAGFIEMSNCKFFNSLDLQHTTFLRGGFFINLEVRGLAIFFSCRYKDDVVMTGIFNRADFSNSIYDSLAAFHNITFHKSCTFSNSQFNGVSEFSTAQFLDRVDFSNSSFNDITEFGKLVFHKQVTFSGCRFSGPILFTSVMFKDTVDFSNVRDVKEPLDLTTVTHTGSIPIILTNSDLSKIKIDYKRFHLVFAPNTNYETQSNVYQALLAQFKERGFTESFEVLDKEYQAFLYSHNHNYIGWFFSKWWWDYGYNKWWIFIWMFGSLLLFTFINIWWVRKLSEDVYELDNLPTLKIFAAKKFTTRFYYSLVYTAVIFFSFNVKRERLKYDNWKLLLYFFFIFSFGLVCLAYTANFILKN